MRRTLLGPHEARRIAIAAQGLAAPRPTGRVDRRHVRKVFDRVGLIQIDSVNVLVRSQELPLWSRLGPHDHSALPAMARDGELFEYWSHEASLLPVALWPLHRWRMDAARDGAMWAGLREAQETDPGYVEAVLQEVRDRGPLSAGELSDPGRKQGPWWGWNKGKQALEYLFWCGTVTARRAAQFERVYDLPERMLPAEVLAAPVPSEHDARRALLLIAARSCGIGTAADIADHFRMKVTVARPLIAELVEEGLLQQVEVAGWKDTAYLHPEATLPRSVDACALLSPFDSLVWFRPRDERLFEFHYRLEIYTPAPKRRFGYYVLPFLLGDRIVARVDLKADRQAGVLRAFASYAEDHTHPREIVAPLAAELVAMSAWLGLGGVEVGPKGDLSAPLARHLRAQLRPSSGGARAAGGARPSPSPSAAVPAPPA